MSDADASRLPCRWGGAICSVLIFWFVTTMSPPTNGQSQNPPLAYPYPAAAKQPVFQQSTFQFPSQPSPFQNPNGINAQPGTLGQLTSPPLQQPAGVPPSINSGQMSPNLAEPYYSPTPNSNLPQQLPGLPNSQFGVLDLDVTVPQAPTQRLSVGATYGSDNSLVGQLIFDEKNFDITAWPRRIDQSLSRRAWSGGGQQFRVEAVPGTELERYLVSWTNPYFRNSNYSLSLSGYLFNRDYFDYDEKRVGGRIGFGRELNDYLSINYGLRMENIEIDNPRGITSSQQLNAAVGDSDLFLASVGLVYDTRVFPYLTGVGSYLGLKFTQAFGDYSYSRGEVDFRNYRTIYQRPDGSGRHILEFRTKLGFSGTSAPIFENYIAGGISSLRGFEFRGVSPIEGGVRVGGAFQWLNSLQYSFPLTQGDMIHGVTFIDFGTVEEKVELHSSSFRVAPGFGLRVQLPYAGLGAPLAFDFAFPVATADGDQEQTFSFLIGVVR
jgi:outer membrane protein insertion porin family